MYCKKYWLHFILISAATSETIMIANAKDSFSRGLQSNSTGSIRRVGQRALVTFTLMVSFLIFTALLFQASTVIVPAGMLEQHEEGNERAHHQHSQHLIYSSNSFMEEDKTYEQGQHYYNDEKKNAKSRPVHYAFVNCSVEVVEDYFSHHFHDSPPKIFDMTCLKHLTEQHPANLFLRTVFVRQYYLEYMATNPKRHVVYLCHSSCGGLGDRLQAMITSFFVALSLNATFTILTEYPVHWDEFFEPSIPDLSLTSPNNFMSQMGLLQSYRQSSGSSRSNAANDTVPFDLHATLQDSAQTSMIVAMHSGREFHFIFADRCARKANESEVEFFRHLIIEEETSLAASTADGDVALIGTGWFRLSQYLLENPVANDFVRHAQLKGIGKAEFAFIFFQLYMSKVSPFLQAAVQPYADELIQEMPARGKPYVIGVHIRIGDWTMQIANLTHPDRRYPPKAVHCIANRIRDICVHKTACAVWVAGDNSLAINTLKRQLANSQIKILNCDEGEILHIDKFQFDQSSDLRHANLRTFLDWYLLANYVDELVITKSGFSEHAAYYTARNADGFRPIWQLMQKTRGKFECKWVDSKWLLHKGPQKPYSHYLFPTVTEQYVP
jgi:hypothetical protein